MTNPAINNQRADFEKWHAENYVCSDPLQWDGDGYADFDHNRAWRAYQAGMQWHPIETAPEGQLLVVLWLDKEDAENPQRHELDYLEDGTWAKHADAYEYFCCVAPPGSRGPSEKAPYAYWMALPAVPVLATIAQSNQKTTTGQKQP